MEKTYTSTDLVMAIETLMQLVGESDALPMEKKNVFGITLVTLEGILLSAYEPDEDIFLADKEELTQNWDKITENVFDKITAMDKLFNEGEE